MLVLGGIKIEFAKAGFEARVLTLGGAKMPGPWFPTLLASGRRESGSRRRRRSCGSCSRCERATRTTKKKETVGSEVIKSLSVVLKPLRDLVVDERDKVQR